MMTCKNNCPVTDSGCTPLCADAKPTLELTKEEVEIIYRIYNTPFDQMSQSVRVDEIEFFDKIEKFLEVTK